MENHIRHDLDGASPEQQALHKAYAAWWNEVDLDGYATERWVKQQKYLTKEDLPDTPIEYPPAPPEIDPIDLDGLATSDDLDQECSDREEGDAALSKEIESLQDGFDDAVLAAQEGAEQIELELQSYSKKSHTHEYAPKSHSHNYVQGPYKIKKTNGCYYIEDL